MRNNTSVPAATFKTLFQDVVSDPALRRLVRSAGLRRRCPPIIRAEELIHGLVFHTVAEAGTLAQHVKALTGKSITDGALSQRRALLPMALFEQIMGAALKPKAQPDQHSAAFYHGLRLCGLDGSQFSVTNTPQVKRQMRKAKSRRGRAAFPKVGVAVLVELGLHNPLAAAIGAEGESEMVLSKRVLSAQSQKSLLIMDRYYGNAELLVSLPEEGQRHFLARVKTNLKRRLLEVYPDGSALVEITSKAGTRQVREILGRVQRNGAGQTTTVRLWTSLLDWRKHSAAEGQVGVLRISFLKTLQSVQGLWGFLEVSADLMTAAQLRLVVRRTLQQLADMAIPKRRKRSCPRALRQPVSSWPRLRKNTDRTGPIAYSVGTIYA